MGGAGRTTGVQSEEPYRLYVVHLGVLLFLYLNLDNTPHRVLDIESSVIQDFFLLKRFTVKMPNYRKPRDTSTLTTRVADAGTDEW